MPRVRASRLWLRLVAPLVLAAASLLASGCGGDSDGGRLLSKEQAGNLLSTLTQVEQNVTERDCTGATEQVATLDSQVDAIARLGRTLRRSLRASVRRLETLVSDACEPAAAPPETTPTTPEPGTTGEEGEEPPPDVKQKAEEEKRKEEEAKRKEEEKQKEGTGNEFRGQGGQGGGAGLPGESDPNGGGSQP